MAEKVYTENMTDQLSAALILVCLERYVRWEFSGI